MLQTKDSTKIIQTAVLILEEGLENAIAASLYKKPAEILFSCSVLLFELLEQAYEQGQVPSCVTGIDLNIDDHASGNSTNLNWQTLKNDKASEKIAGDSQVLEKQQIINSASLTGKLTLEFVLSTGQFIDTDINSLPEQLTEELANAWYKLFSALEDHIWRNYSKIPPASPNQNKQNLYQLIERVFVSRLREALQRLEELLPHTFRLENEINGTKQEASLLFLRRRITEPVLPESGSHEELGQKKPDHLSYVLSREDLQTLDAWANEDPQQLKYRLQTALTQILPDLNAENNSRQDLENFISNLVELESPARYMSLRQAAEQSLHSGCSATQRHLFRHEQAFNSGFPGLSLNSPIDFTRHQVSPNKTDAQVLLIITALVQANTATVNIRDFDYYQWPIRILGNPLFLIQVPHSLLNPFVDAKPQTLTKLLSLLNSMFHINESAWHIVFDIYCELFVERFSQTYLEFASKRFHGQQVKHSGNELENMLKELNQVNHAISYITGITVAEWKSSPSVGDYSQTLWDLQVDHELMEEDRSIASQDPGESMRLARLEQEKVLLQSLLLAPADNHAAQQFMHEHLTWRIGHHVRYQLPLLLMTLDHGTHYSTKRYQDVLRHELSGFVGKSLEILANSDSVETTDNDDLRRLLRLVRQKIGNVTNDSLTFVTKRPGRPVYIKPIIDFVKRNFPAKFAMTTQAGLVCQSTVHIEHEQLSAWVQEEDFYAVWRNLWNNGRQILDDVSRDTPSETDRRERQQEIINIAGPYSERFVDTIPPLPHLAAFFYEIQNDKGTCFVMDILDNAPQVKSGPISYPERIKTGHYGLSIVQKICLDLNNMGFHANFSSPRVLDEEKFKTIEPFILQSGLSFNAINDWSVTSVTFLSRQDS